jgi:hypothetical protein
MLNYQRVLEIMGILGMNDHNMVEQAGTVKKMGFNQWLVKKCVWNSAKDTPYFRASLVWRNTHVDMGYILSQRLEILNAPWFCVKRRGHTCCIKHVNVSTPQNLPFPGGLPLAILWRTQNMSGWWFQTWMDYYPFHIWDVILPLFARVYVNLLEGIYGMSSFPLIVTPSRWLLHHQPVIHHNYGKSPCSMGKSTISMVNHQMFDGFPSRKPPSLMRRSASFPAHHGMVSSPIPKGSQPAELVPPSLWHGVCWWQTTIIYHKSREIYRNI